MTKSTITREPITHDLKIYPEFFSAVCTGVKRAELRKNDRDYRVGDTLHLMETPRGSCHQTGEFINVKITHIADVGEWMPGYVLLSVELQERRKAAMDSDPVAYAWVSRSGKKHLTRCEPEQWRDAVIVTPLYSHAQPAPVAPVCTCPSGDGSLRWPCPVHPGNSPAIPDGYVMVPREPTKKMILAGQEELESCIDNGFDSDIDGNRYDYTDIVPDAPHRVFMAMLAASPQEPKP